MYIELHVTEGPAKGRHFKFETPDCFLFGRSADAHISLPDDRFVSRQHFMLEISPPDCRLIELDSKNGVFVNGVRYGGRKPPKTGMQQAPDGVKEVWLKHGDTITVGDTRIRVSVHSGDTAHEESQKDNIRNDDIIRTLSIPDYQLGEQIGRGVMGGVYKAIEIRTGTPVAIKIVLPEVTIEAQKIKPFQRELSIISQLRHDHIVPLLKYGKVKDGFFFVFGYSQGINLEQICKYRGGRLSLDEAAPIMLGLLNGLAYAHRVRITYKTPSGQMKAFKGIVHQDIQPHNILLSRQADVLVPQLTEFGLAKGLEIAGLTSIMNPKDLKAPLYWPREKITHYGTPHPATDVFSLAAVFYEMLTGVWVREGFRKLLTRAAQTGRHPSISDYLAIIAANPPQHIRQQNQEIPEPVAAVLDKALQEAELPQDNNKMREVLKYLRYPDAEAFLEDLVRAFKKVGIPTTEKVLRAQALVRPKHHEPEPRSMEENMSHIQKFIRPDVQESDQLSAGSVVYSVIQPTAKREVALFVLDVEHSTQYVSDAGDTSFSTLIGNIYHRLKNHGAVAELIFLKCTGDGFLAVFTSVAAALSVASSFLNRPVHPDIHVRMALHWGEVIAGPEGDVLGKEVHCVCRVAGVKQEDLIESDAETPPLALYNRVLITEQGLTQLGATVREKFRFAGKFRLKGFDTPCKLWVYSL